LVERKLEFNEKFIFGFSVSHHSLKFISSLIGKEQICTPAKIHFINNNKIHPG